MLNVRQQHAWLFHGGGNETLNGVYRGFDIHALPCGNTGNRMGGWLRKEIKGVEDLRGLKSRVAGLAATSWRSSAWCRGRSRLATSTRRWSGARSTA